MKYEVSLPNFDFRDFLPMINRTIFKSSFNPLEVWKKLGKDYNFAMWGRVLKKYRVRLYEEDAEHLEVCGEFHDDVFKIILTINKPETFLVHELKFLLIQTLMHEYIHVNQFEAHEEQYDKTIGYRSDLDDDEEYLCRWGEIQAFGHCAALDIHNDRVDTMTRYMSLHDKPKKEFYKQMMRWVNKYSNKYSIQTILIEPHESSVYSSTSLGRSDLFYSLPKSIKTDPIIPT